MYKMAKLLVSLLVVALMLETAKSQTFQYSRGWTNGKRSYDFPVPSPQVKYQFLPAQNVDARTSESLPSWCCDANCAPIRVVKFLRNTDKPRLYLVPCDTVRARRRIVSQTKMLDAPTADERYRRPSSNDYGSTNDNY